MAGSAASSKRTAPPARSIFSEGGTLQLVLDFLGSGYALFVRPVSKEWNLKYNAVADQPRGTMSSDDGSYPHAHTCRCTSLSAVWSSASTLKVAQYQFNTSKRQYKAGCLLSITELITVRDDLGLVFTKDVAEGAAASGSLPKLKQLFREHGCPLISKKGGNAICELAAKAGHVEMLQWLQGEGKRKFTAATALAAAEGGHSVAVRFLVDAKCPWSPAATAAVARHGDLELLKWMVEHNWRRCKWSPEAIASSAARTGRMEVLQYVLDQHAGVNQHTLYGAVMSDTPELVQYLLQHHGLQLNAGLLHAAAEAGLLRMVQYLVQQQCAGGQECLRAAAAGGHLAVLQCLRAAGHRWSITDSCDAALRNGHAAVALYILNNWEVEVEPWHQWTHMSYKRIWLCLAGRAGMLEVAQKLREMGVEWPTELRYKGKPWVSEMVQWARAAGCTAPL
jgi:hypothetical protein